MHERIIRVLAAAGAGAALAGLGLGLGPAGTSGAAAGTVRAASTAAARTTSVTGPGAQLWVRRYAGPANEDSRASAVAAGRGGRKVFVTGTSGGSAVTIAYDAITGARLWAGRYAGPGGKGAGASAVAVSPDGGRIFIAGSTSDAAGADYATIAYNAVTGAPIWQSLYNGPGNAGDVASSLAVSPDGRTVFVTGGSKGRTSGLDYATVAYDAATGRQLWVARLGGAGSDAAVSVAAGPGGARVYVTGRTGSAASGADYGTVAYDAATGRRVWVSRYNGPAKGNEAGDAPSAVAVGPGGGTVYVTGTSTQVSGGRLTAAATIAYNSSTGRRLWLARYTGQAGNGAGAGATGIVASPAGGVVFVTGFSGVVLTTTNYATIAYNASTGAREWLKIYDSPSHGYDIASCLAVSPGGSKVFVTGFSDSDYATLAYRASTGAQLWVRRYNGPANGEDFATSVSVSPGGSRLFVTGKSAGAQEFSDYLTIAYQP